MIEYYKFYQNYIKENNIKINPHSMIFLDEKDLLNIVKQQNILDNDDLNNDLFFR